MSNSHSPIKVKIHSKTKQIKKHKPSLKVDQDSPSSLSDSTDKKYKTYTKSQKLIIISDLKKALLSKTKNTDFQDHQLLKHMESISKAQYNQLIETILELHVPSALKYKGDKKLWQKELKQWRKQLKSWIKNIDKPETRGSARIVPQDRATEFKQKIVEIIQNLPSRTFDLFRERVLDALREMYGSQGEYVINEGTFSKHFWYDYMRTNPDIEQLYSALPICRNTAKRNMMKGDENLSPAKQKEEDDLLFDDKTQGSENPMFEDSQFENRPHGIFEEGIFNEDSCFSMSNATAKTGFPEPESDQLIISSKTIQGFVTGKAAFDFYKMDKMIVETEDNETQKSYFRQFYVNGMEI